jgi:hypothetical protein
MFSPLGPRPVSGLKPPKLMVTIALVVEATERV